MTTTPRLKRALRLAALCGLALVLLAGQALALGLGRIDVKSRAGEPLLAEIQIISSDPSELEQLRARLASPETFRRIGLEAPDAVVAGLEFTVALDARGNPVIRVTTREPVTQPTVTFLVEVDWGQGRLVREYSALVDTPQTLAAGSQPVIEAPAAAPSNTIVRSPEVAAGADPERMDEPAAVADAPVQADEDAAPAVAPAPVAAPARPPVAPPAPTLADEYGPVQAGETLGEIAQRLVGDGISRDQAIVALFRANPEAFIANNLNLVRQGAVLRIPDRSEIAGLDLGESRALMREQNAAWRAMIQPAPQPDAALAGAADVAAAAGEGAGADAGSRTADARLEIVPPSAGDGRQAGIRSGIQAGGEGEMLRQELQQELQQSQETLAARDAEVAELKARVADLERLQAQQAQLIEMKDSEMAAVQERLASAPEPAVQSGGLPWAWIGLGLLVVALGAWLLMRRAPKPAPRPRFDSATLAAAAPRQDGEARSTDADPVPAAEAREASRASGPAVPSATGSSPAASDAAPGPRQAAPAPGPTATAPPVPAWHAGKGMEAAGASVAPPSASAPAPAPAPAPAGIVDVADVGTAASGVGGAAGGSAGVERIELARAYIDLGDADTARELLREVQASGDPASREEATRLLDGLA